MTVKEQEKQEEKQDKVSQIAKDFMDKVKSKEGEKQEKKETKQEAKPEKTSEEAQKQAEKDEEILIKKDEDLSEEEKGRKEELTKKSKEKLEKIDDKVEKRKEEIQKDIDALIAEKKTLEGDVGEIKRANEEIAELKKRLSELEKPKQEEDQKTKLEAHMSQLIQKQLEEDKDKPREQRREMTKDELDEWYLEDPVSATEWMQERTLRRVQEKSNYAKSEQEKKTVEQFNEQLTESLKKLVERFPGVKDKTSEQYKLCDEIAQSNPDKYIQSANGPELVMQEMEKRLNGGEKKTFTLEDLEQAKREAAEMERKRIAGLDEGIHSTYAGGGSGKGDDPVYQKQLDILNNKRLKAAGYTKEQLDEAINRRKSIKGVNIR